MLGMVIECLKLASDAREWQVQKESVSHGSLRSSVEGCFVTYMKFVFTSRSKLARGIG